MSQKSNIATKSRSVLFFTKSGFKAAELVFNYPNREFHVRGMAKESGLSTTAVKAAINDLEKMRIVKVAAGDVVTSVRADLDSPAYSFYKRIFNLYRLERWSFVENLKTIFAAETIVLFGSFAKGEDIEKSDVDVLVLSKTRPGPQLCGLIALWEEELNRKINLHVMPSLDGASNEFKNALANGIVLYGYLKVT